MARIDWDSPYTPYTKGFRCDICGTEDDPEGANMSWWTLSSMPGDLHLCSLACVHKVDEHTRPAYVEAGYVGGRTYSPQEDSDG